MMREGITGSAIVAVLVAMLFLQGSGPAPRDEATGKRASSEKQVALAAANAKRLATPALTGGDGPWTASQEYFEIGSAHECRARPWCIPYGEKVQAMIGIAPDPVHSHFALAFDRTIEAIQLAAASEKYVIDRYWLPWSIEANRAISGPEGPPTGGNARDQYPGLLIFRWSGDRQDPRPKALFVFVVADTATAGINGKQFLHAVKYVQQLSSLPSDEGIRIMGPTFSGSLASLRRLTDASAPQRFKAYSGTLSSVDAASNQGLLREDAKLIVKSFVRDTESEICDFISWLNNIHPFEKPQVAILSEAATTFGLANQGSSCEFTSLIYPREISSLRNAYQTLESGAVATANKTASEYNPHLALNFSDPSNNSDEPPEFSPAQDPVSKEVVLMNLAAELRRRHYRYIGLTGSSALDMLFLSTYLRRAVPDARLFLFGSDLMFEHETENVPYVGALSVSTYPLITRNIRWFDPSPTATKWLPFGDQYEEGQYNATRRTLEELLLAAKPATRARIQQGSLESSNVTAVGLEEGSRLYEYKRLFFQSSDPSPRPPRWLTVVGKEGIGRSKFCRIPSRLTVVAA